MTTTWIRTLMLSAAALTMGSAAYGQSRTVAEIPFSFRINGHQMPAGKYSFDRPNKYVKEVLKLDNGQQVDMALGHSVYGDVNSQARLIFSCREGSGCTLVQAWYSNGVGLEFPKPKTVSGQNEHMAVVVMRKSQAD